MVLAACPHGLGAPLTSSSTTPGGANQITITGTGTGLQNSILNTESEQIVGGNITVSPIIGPVAVTNGFFLPWATVASSPSAGATPTAIDFTGITGSSPGVSGPYSIAAFGGEKTETLANASANDVVLITGSDSTLASSKSVAGVLITGNGKPVASPVPFRKPRR